MRLTHVLDKLGNPTELSAIPSVLKAMVEDVYAESGLEESREVNKAISTRASWMYKKRINA